jgi:hypothetical protein
MRPSSSTIAPGNGSAVASVTLPETRSVACRSANSNSVGIDPTLGLLFVYRREKVFSANVTRAR